MVLATTMLFLVNSRTVIFDIALAFFVVSAIFAGYLAEESEGSARRNWYLLGAAAAGFATLVKGPVGFLIPILVLLVFNRLVGRRGVWKRLFAPLNWLVFFGVVLPWFIGLSLSHPDFPHYGLVEESFHRFTTTQFHRAKPFYFYGIIVVGMFLPWSLLLPESAVAAWKSRRNLTRADVLCIVWAVTVVVFFSCSKSKMPGYILSTTVACGILVARLFDRAFADSGGKAARVAAHAAVGFAVVCLLAMATAIFLSTHTQMLARPLGISVTEAAQFRPHITAAAVMLLLSAVVILLAGLKRNAKFCFVCFVLFPLLLVNVNYPILNVVFSAKSARALAQQMSTLPPQTELACLECFPSGLTFYLGRTLTLITADGGELTSNYILYRLKTENPWPTNLVSAEQLDKWLASRNHPVYLLAKQGDRPRLEAIAAGRGAAVQQLTPFYIGVLLPPP
jgi:4-amino-4-deoxy-L-arabinose transferase-like glycosyltransferase